MYRLSHTTLQKKKKKKKKKKTKKKRNDLRLRNISFTCAERVDDRLQFCYEIRLQTEIFN